MPAVISNTSPLQYLYQADMLALKVSGTLGILLLAKERGKLGAVRPMLARLDALGFRLQASTRQIVLHLAHEPD